MNGVPPLPEEYDTDSLVRFACECAEGLSRHEAFRSHRFPRSESHLERAIHDLYPGLIQRIFDAPLKDRSSLTVHGMTWCTKGPDPSHGRRPGPVALFTTRPPRLRRFVKAHECFNRVLDIPALDLKLQDLIDGAIVIKGYKQTWADAPLPAILEHLAEIAAMEFFFPYEERKKVLASCTTAIPFRNIARKYGIPVTLTRFYLRPSFMTYFGRFAKI